MSKRLISIVTYPRGGPRSWSEGLSGALSDIYSTRIVTGRLNYIVSCLSRNDLIHSNVGLPFSYASRYVLTIHGNYKKEKLLGRLSFPLAIQKAHIVTVPSYYLKKQLNLTNAFVIPNGIDYPPSGKTDYRVTEPSPVVGTLTNFDFPQKAEGIIVLAKIIREFLPAAKLLIGGSGTYLNTYRARTKQILPDAEFLGYCEKEYLFPQLDIFAYYSLQDNQPLALLEAMAYGLPVLSNNIGAVSEILTGPLSECLCQSPDQYAVTLSGLIKSIDARKYWGSQCRLKAKHYSWNIVAHQFMQLYEV